MMTAGRRVWSGLRRAGYVPPVVAVLLACVLSAGADKVVLRIRAGNPIDTPQTVEIRSNLPVRVATNDVISTGGLDIGYDIGNDVYYVYGEVTLGPRETRMFDVEIRDIWTIDRDYLARLRDHAGSLAGKLESTRFAETAAKVRAEIESNLARIVERQEANAIGPGIRPIQHIRAYEENLETLKRVRTDLGHLENLVLGTNQDAGQLLGESRAQPKPGGAETLAPDVYKTVTVRITVRNTSPNETRRLRVERDLPEEIRLQDVVDPGELNVGARPGSGITYVYRDGVEIPPGGTQAYDIEIRDRWNISQPRIASLRARVEDVQARLGDRERYAAVHAALDRILAELARIETTSGPEQVNDAYVAFYRRQGRELDVIDQEVTRIETALRPVDQGTELGFPGKPPSAKTTWGIIYGILGFLALLSLGFFLRWYVKR